MKSYCKEIIAFYQQSRNTSNLCKHTKKYVFMILICLCWCFLCFFHQKSKNDNKNVTKLATEVATSGCFPSCSWWKKRYFESTHWMGRRNANTVFINRNLKRKCQISLRCQGTFKLLIHSNVLAFSYSDWVQPRDYWVSLWYRMSMRDGIEIECNFSQIGSQLRQFLDNKDLFSSLRSIRTVLLSELIKQTQHSKRTN